MNLNQKRYEKTLFEDLLEKHFQNNFLLVFLFSCDVYPTLYVPFIRSFEDMEVNHTVLQVWLFLLQFFYIAVLLVVTSLYTLTNTFCFPESSKRFPETWA